MPDPILTPVEAAREVLRVRVDEASERLRAWDHLRAPNGMTPDAVKFSPEYREAKAAFDGAFAALRAFNRIYKPKRSARYADR